MKPGVNMIRKYTYSNDIYNQNNFLIYHYNKQISFITLSYNFHGTFHCRTRSCPHSSVSIHTHIYLYVSRALCLTQRIITFIFIEHLALQKCGHNHRIPFHLYIVYSIIFFATISIRVLQHAQIVYIIERLMVNKRNAHERVDIFDFLNAVNDRLQVCS